MTSMPTATSPNDRLFSYLFAGALGSAAIALLFLLIDALRGDPFFTPSFMGSVLVLGQDPAAVGPVRIDMVALYSLIHFAAFATVGAVFTAVYERSPWLSGQPVLLAGLLMAALGTSLVFLDVVLYPGLIDGIGPIAVIAANAVASVVMAWFIHSSLGQEALGVVASPSRSS
jgi:hypothetical protein